MPYPDPAHIDVEQEASRFFESTDLTPSDKPRAVLLVGPICTGKTTIRNSDYSSGFVLLDAGEIFLNLTGSSEPRFPGPLEATILVIGRRIFLEAANSRFNLVTEMLGTDGDVMISVIEALKAYGYVVEVTYVSAELDQCVKRQADRGDDNLSAYFTEGFHCAWILGLDPRA